VHTCPEGIIPVDELQLFGDFDDQGDVDEAAKEGDTVRESVRYTENKT